MFKALTAIVALAASASVMAQSDVTLNSLAHDAATRASFNQMVKGHQLPAWVTTGGTGSLSGTSCARAWGHATSNDSHNMP